MQNPLPVDLAKVVMMYDEADQTMKLRPEDATSFSSEGTYTHFIAAAAIGVRQRPASLRAKSQPIDTRAFILLRARAGLDIDRRWRQPSDPPSV
jgi:hypothetical protein